MMPRSPWRGGPSVSTISVETVHLTLAPLAAGAKQGERVYRIGLLSEGAHPFSKGGCAGTSRPVLAKVSSR